MPTNYKKKYSELLNYVKTEPKTEATFSWSECRCPRCYLTLLDHAICDCKNLICKDQLPDFATVNQRLFCTICSEGNK